jgi:hypothetical protein
MSTRKIGAKIVSAVVVNIKRISTPHPKPMRKGSAVLNESELENFVGSEVVYLL